RGTGDSGAFVCPTVQNLRTLDAIRPEAVAACAATLGPRRAFYTTSDSALDLDQLRARLGADKMALMGVSYGTHVALHYRRGFPTRVDKLTLDSIVGPGNPDGFLLDTYRAFPRILREQCTHSLCSNTTLDPVTDVGLLVRRLQNGPLRGSAFDATGHKRPVEYTTAEQISFLLTRGAPTPRARRRPPGPGPAPPPRAPPGWGGPGGWRRGAGRPPGPRSAAVPPPPPAGGPPFSPTPCCPRGATAGRSPPPRSRRSRR